MRAGELRHRITIQEQGETKDSFGADTLTWQDFATVWAAIEPLQGREYFAAQQVHAEVTTKIRIRYLPGVKPSMLVLFGNRKFNILAVTNSNERNRELVLMAKELVE